MITYPANRHQQKVFAQRYIRKLVKACVANELGADVAWLLTVVVTTEDAKRYRGAVTFHNAQLLPLLGFAKWERLDAARRKAVAAGLLHYEPADPGSRQPGRYWVLEPQGFDDIGDAPVDDSLHANDTPQTDTVAGDGSPKAYPSNGYGEGERKAKAYPAEGYAQGDGQGDGQGELSILCPNPFPLNTSPEQSPDAPKAAPAKSKKAKPAPSFLPDDMAVARGMWADIDAMQPGRKPPNFDQWANDVRLLRERDRRSYVEIRGLWRLVQSDSFWRVNVLSPAKLRERWDDLQLRLSRNNGTKASSPARIHTPGRYDNDDRY